MKTWKLFLTFSYLKSHTSNASKSVSSLVVVHFLAAAQRCSQNTDTPILPELSTFEGDTRWHVKIFYEIFKQNELGSSEDCSKWQGAEKPKSYSILYIIYAIIIKESLFSPKSLISKIRDYVIIGPKSTMKMKNMFCNFSTLLSKSRFGTSISSNTMENFYILCFKVFYAFLQLCQPYTHIKHICEFSKYNFKALYSPSSFWNESA